MSDEMIKSGMDSKSCWARFEAERQAQAMMDPNIAKVLDAGTGNDGRPFNRAVFSNEQTRRSAEVGSRAGAVLGH